MPNMYFYLYHVFRSMGIAYMIYRLLTEAASY
jgi:hypothetical protein